MRIDIEQIQEKILTLEERQKLKQLGNCIFNKDDFKVKISNGVVVTILEKE